MRSKNIETIKIKSEFFNPKDTLTCGQVFRYKPFKNGYLVFSLDKCCYLYEKEGSTKVDGKWIPNGKYEWWLNKYKKIN